MATIGRIAFHKTRKNEGLLRLASHHMKSIRRRIGPECSTATKNSWRLNEPANMGPDVNANKDSILAEIRCRVLRMFQLRRASMNDVVVLLVHKKATAPKSNTFVPNHTKRVALQGHASQEWLWRYRLLSPETNGQGKRQHGFDGWTAEIEDDEALVETIARCSEDESVVK